MVEFNLGKEGGCLVILSKHVAQTEQIGAQLAATLTPGAILALRGDLGAGKTAFVRGLAQGLGYDGRVTSPTFTIVNEYPARLPLFHFDLYRLGGEDELYDIGFDEYLTRGGVCAIEWSERAQELIQAQATHIITLRRINDEEREITVEVL